MRTNICRCVEPRPCPYIARESLSAPRAFLDMLTAAEVRKALRTVQVIRRPWEDMYLSK